MNVMAGFAAVSLTALFLCIALGAFAYSFSFSHLTRAPHEMSTLLSSTFATTSTIILHLFFFSLSLGVSQLATYGVTKAHTSLNKKPQYSLFVCLSLPLRPLSHHFSTPSWSCR
jgi:hypothetical protein